MRSGFRLGWGLALPPGNLTDRERLEDPDHLRGRARRLSERAAVGELPADPGLGGGEERVEGRVARLVRSGDSGAAGRRRAGAVPADAEGEALPGLPARGAGD